MTSTICRINSKDTQYSHPSNLKSTKDKDKMKALESCYETNYTQTDALESVLAAEGNNWKPFDCEKCGAQFKSLIGYNGHQLIHLNLKPYFCLYCDKPFRDKTTLRRHEEYHSTDRKYKCQLCKESKFFVTRDNLKSHENNCHPSDTPWQCSICPKKFATKGIRNIHFKSHPIRLKLQILMENESNSVTGMSGQTVEGKSVENLKCGVCQKEYPSRKRLIKHEQRRGHQHRKESQWNDQEQEDYIHECPICLQTFKSIKAFGLHYNSHESQ